MAKQTNKTNHILNLLSGNSRKKENEEEQNANSSIPPVLPKNRKTSEKNKTEAVENTGDETADTQENPEYTGDEKNPAAAIDVVDKKEEERINENLINSINSALEEELKEFEKAGGEAPETVPVFPEESYEEPDVSSVFPAEGNDGVTGDFRLTDEVAEDSVPESYSENEERTENKEQKENEEQTESETEECETEECETTECKITGQPENKDEYKEPVNRGFITLNVMEELVNLKVMEYINKFQICTCDRCVADVRALALTNLPGKYVVVEEGAVTPMLHFYEQKFNAQVVVELTKACVTVGAKPHH